MARAAPWLAVLVASLAVFCWPAFVGSQPASTATSSALGDDAQLALVADKLIAQGWYNEPGAGTEDGRLAEVQARLASTGSEWGLVALADNPALGTRVFSNEVLDLVRAKDGPKTVVVLTPTEIAASSRTYEEADVQQALAASIPGFNRDVVAGFETLFAELTDGAAPPRPAPETTFPAVPIAGAAVTALAAVVLIIAGYRRRTLAS